MNSPKMKAINKAYGDSGPIVLSKLESDPIQTIPIILNRMIQQKEMLFKKKLEQNKIWKEVCENNFYKSLDHKVYYFKQIEKKMTNMKGIANINNRVYSGYKGTI